MLPLSPSAQLLGFGQEALEYGHETSSCEKTGHILSSCSRQQVGSIRSFACRALAAVMRALRPKGATESRLDLIGREIANVGLVEVILGAENTSSLDSLRSHQHSPEALTRFHRQRQPRGSRYHQ